MKREYKRSIKQRDVKRWIFKRLSWYISILILIVVIAGCGKGNEIKEDSKETQIKRALRKH